MLPMARSSSTRAGRLVAASGVVVLLGTAVGLVVWERWHGPIILSLSTGHGIDAGDLPVIPLVALALHIGSVRSPALRSGGPTPRAPSLRWVGPTSAVVLGAVLLVVTVVNLNDRGPLVPSGGGTFDGEVQSVAGRSATPVGMWSYVAMTYDGTNLRLFVNGIQVSSRATTGTIETSANPLWLGGNQLYGEYFEGMIDDLRIYNRALGESEIQADMATPVTAGNPAREPADLAAAAPTLPTYAAGLVGAYSFDAESGAVAIDDSGNGNVGMISGATWTTQGRYGNALRFDGAGDTVRVPASASLDVGSGLALSAWVRPTTAQSGWRTIVQREPDTYFLTAGSDLEGLVGRIDDLLAGAVVAAATWFSVVMVRSRGSWIGQRRRTWRIAAAMLLVGCVVDAAFAPSATLFGPTLLAVWFAASASHQIEAAVGWLLASALTATTAASLAGVAWFGIRMQKDDGDLVRSAAFGVALCVIGLVMLRYGPRSQKE
jgi:Concanavalin A-like lectin/glucanases superfamily